MVKNGITTNISICHQCLTVMDFYANKSIEVSWISLKRAFPNSQNIFCLEFKAIQEGYILNLIHWKDSSYFASSALDYCARNCV